MLHSYFRCLVTGSRDSPVTINAEEPFWLSKMLYLFGCRKTCQIKHYHEWVQCQITLHFQSPSENCTPAVWSPLIPCGIMAWEQSVKSRGEVGVGGGGVPNETDWNEMCLRPCTFRGKKLSGPKRHIVYIHHGQQRLFLVTQWSCAAANNKVLFFISVFESFLTNSTFTKRNTKKYGNMIFEFNQNFSFLIFCNISENSPPHVYLEFFGFFVCTATERCQWRQNGCSG